MDTAPLDVLVVEDSPSQARRLSLMLQGHGCAVREAEHGVAALAELDGSAPDIVISDVVMPEMDGFELCRHIRAEPRYDGVPIILLTTLTDPSCLIAGLAAGADNYLMKPYTEDILLKRIEQTLAAHGEEHSDDGACRITFNGKTYAITSDRPRMAGFLLSSFEDAVQRYEELQHANHQLRDALATITRLEARYHRLLEQSAEAVLVVTVDGDILYANSPAFGLFRRGGGELEGSRFPYPLEPETTREIAFEVDGEPVYAELRVAETTWSGEKAFLVSLWETTENVILREQLRDMSLTDELTGLSNRRRFLALAEQQLKMSRRTGQFLELLYLDMDSMKAINDTYGHAAGDDALIEFGALMRKTLRDSDIVARVGGDEFAVLLVGTDPRGPDPKARLKRAVAARNSKTRLPYRLGYSTGGVEIRPGDDRSLTELLNEADERMYANKRRRSTETA